MIISKEKLTNIGKYWPKIGQQQTLYTPGVFTSDNTYNYEPLIEFERSTCNSSTVCYVELFFYRLSNYIDNKNIFFNWKIIYANKNKSIIILILRLD